MKLKLLVVMLLCSGCLPLATKQEVLDLTNAVSEIIPVVREVAGEDNEKVEKILTDVETINEAVATADDPIEAVSKGWDASKPFNPYYTHGLLVLGLLRLWQKKKESDNSLEEVVLGVEDAKKSGDGTKTLKASLNATESIVTRKKVAKILA